MLKFLLKPFTGIRLFYNRLWLYIAGLESLFWLKKDIIILKLSLKTPILILLFFSSLLGDLILQCMGYLKPFKSFIFLFKINTLCKFIIRFLIIHFTRLVKFFFIKFYKYLIYVFLPIIFLCLNKTHIFGFTDIHELKKCSITEIDNYLVNVHNYYVRNNYSLIWLRFFLGISFYIKILSNLIIELFYNINLIIISFFFYIKFYNPVDAIFILLWNITYKYKVIIILLYLIYTITIIFSVKILKYIWSDIKKEEKNLYDFLRSLLVINVINDLHFDNFEHYALEQFDEWENGYKINYYDEFYPDRIYYHNHKEYCDYRLYKNKKFRRSLKTPTVRSRRYRSPVSHRGYFITKKLYKLNLFQNRKMYVIFTISFIFLQLRVLFMKTPAWEKIKLNYNLTYYYFVESLSYRIQNYNILFKVESTVILFKFYFIILSYFIVLIVIGFKKIYYNVIIKFIKTIIMCKNILKPSEELFILTRVNLIFLTLLIIVFIILGGSLPFLERKYLSLIQRRIGPKFNGYNGRYQTVNDAIKVLLKELILLKISNLILFLILPLLLLIVNLLMCFFLVWPNNTKLLNINHTLLLIFQIELITSIIVSLTGLLVRNKYTLMAAIRTINGVFVFEVFITAIFSYIYVYTNNTLVNISNLMGVFNFKIFNFITVLPLLIYFILILLKKVPFDIIEAETELIMGPIIEHSGFLGGVFILTEYIHLFFWSFFSVIYFFY